MNLFSRFLKDESGATAIEYGLIASLVAVAIITADILISARSRAWRNCQIWPPQEPSQTHRREEPSSRRIGRPTRSMLGSRVGFTRR